MGKTLMGWIWGFGPIFSLKSTPGARDVALLHRPIDDRVPSVGRALVVGGQGVSVDSRRDVRIGMAETCRYRGQRNAVRKQVRGVRMPQSVKAAVLDSGFSDSSNDHL